jgi:hypothetical protein
MTRPAKLDQRKLEFLNGYGPSEPVCRIHDGEGEALLLAKPMRLRLREHGRRPIIQHTVRPVVIVVPAPDAQLHTGIFDRSEPFHIQAVIPQPRIEAHAGRAATGRQ